MSFLRKHGLHLLFLVFVTLVCLAAISVDTSGINTDGISSDPKTVSLTVATNSDKIMLACGGIQTNGNLASVTFNGDSFTNVAGATVQSGGFASSDIWYRLEPDVATASLTANIGGSTFGGVGGLVLFGVDQMSPIRDSDETSTASGTTLNLTLTTVAGDYVFYSAFVFGGGGSDPTALDHTAGSATGETEIGEVEPVGDSVYMSCAYAVASGTSTQIGYSWTNNGAASLVAVSVAPAASASTRKNLTLIGVQ